jgi:DNA-binding NarL/FixJ family response regulator
MTDKTILALVVSSAGLLQNGVLALMTTIPQISAVLVAEDINSAKRMIENHQPTLIVMDMTLSKAKVVIKKIKVQYPHIHLIILAEDIEQQKQVEALGITSVLLKGFSPEKFITTVETIINYQEETAQIQANTEGGLEAN